MCYFHQMKSSLNIRKLNKSLWVWQRYKQYFKWTYKPKNNHWELDFSNYRRKTINFRKLHNLDLRRPFDIRNLCIILISADSDIIVKEKEYKMMNQIKWSWYGCFFSWKTKFISLMSFLLFRAVSYTHLTLPTTSRV